MGDADRAVEPGPDSGDKDNGDRKSAHRPEVAVLVARLQDDVDGLRAFPLEGIPPALGDRPSAWNTPDSPIRRSLRSTLTRLRP